LGRRRGSSPPLCFRAAPCPRLRRQIWLIAVELALGVMQLAGIGGLVTGAIPGAA
jgi:hypothetical protein